MDFLASTSLFFSLHPILTICFLILAVVYSLTLIQHTIARIYILQIFKFWKNTLEGDFKGKQLTFKKMEVFLLYFSLFFIFIGGLAILVSLPNPTQTLMVFLFVWCGIDSLNFLLYKSNPFFFVIRNTCYTLYTALLKNKLYRKLTKLYLFNRVKHNLFNFLDIIEGYPIRIFLLHAEEQGITNLLVKGIPLPTYSSLKIVDDKTFIVKETE